MSKLPVGVVGAAGLAGQQFLSALARHPRFSVVRVAGSQRRKVARRRPARRTWRFSLVRRRRSPRKPPGPHGRRRRPL
jgi:aspartate-semialdehyde dehydrogenase